MALLDKSIALTWTFFRLVSGPRLYIFRCSQAHPFLRPCLKLKSLEACLLRLGEKAGMRTGKTTD
jgi:hypothetical protein